jgi:hypothetical protein
MLRDTVPRCLSGEGVGRKEGRRLEGAVFPWLVLPPCICASVHHSTHKHALPAKNPLCARPAKCKVEVACMPSVGALL